MYQTTGPNGVQAYKTEVALFLLFTFYTALTCNCIKVFFSRDHSNQKLSFAKKTDAFSI